MDRQAAAAAAFAKKWAGVGDEKQDSQRFWIELLQTVYGVENPAIMARLSRQKSDDFIVNQAAAFAASSNMAGKYASAGGMSPIAEWQRS